MFNTAIIVILAILLVLSIVTAVAEPIFAVDSGIGRFFRAIRIRLREISLTSFCVTSVTLLMLGLTLGDDNFTFIWLAVSLMFAILCVLLPGDVIGIYKSRKRASLNKRVCAKSGEVSQNTKLAALARELTPIEVEE